MRGSRALRALPLTSRMTGITPQISQSGNRQSSIVSNCAVGIRCDITAKQSSVPASDGRRATRHWRSIFLLYCRRNRLQGNNKRTKSDPPPFVWVTVLQPSDSDSSLDCPYDTLSRPTARRALQRTLRKRASLPIALRPKSVSRFLVFHSCGFLLIDAKPRVPFRESLPPVLPHRPFRSLAPRWSPLARRRRSYPTRVRR